MVGTAAVWVSGAEQSGRDGAARRFAATVSGGPELRLRSAADTAWTGSVAYGRRDGGWFRIGHGFQAIARLILPVLLLLFSFAAIWLYLDTPANSVIGGPRIPWLSLGHLLVPLSFLCVHLTNRRYGPATAFAQVVLALAAAAAVVMFVAPGLPPVIRAVPDLRVAGAFAGAFFVASFVSIIVFDGARGPRWWMAPLLGMLTAVVIFALVFYPAAYAGAGDWTGHMTVHLGFLAVLAVLSLVPYWILRGVVRPLPGYNGY
jgi:uncharacterized PurR-regulated membrane protein YhhQ (DUF165 family)